MKLLFPHKHTASELCRSVSDSLTVYGSSFSSKVQISTLPFFMCVWLVGGETFGKKLLARALPSIDNSLCYILFTRVHIIFLSVWVFFSAYSSSSLKFLKCKWKACCWDEERKKKNRISFYVNWRKEEKENMLLAKIHALWNGWDEHTESMGGPHSAKHHDK